MKAFIFNCPQSAECYFWLRENRPELLTQIWREECSAGTVDPAQDPEIRERDEQVSHRIGLRLKDSIVSECPFDLTNSIDGECSGMFLSDLLGQALDSLDWQAIGRAVLLEVEPPVERPIPELI